MRRAGTARRPLRTHDLAKALGVHVNTIRLYEASGFMAAARGENGYRLCGTAEFGGLRVIRTLVYSLMAVLQMLRQSDAGNRHNLGAALDLPTSEDEPVWVIADRWHSSLVALEARARAIIRQVGKMIEMMHGAGEEPHLPAPSPKPKSGL